MRRAWTGVACEDPFVRAGSGRSAFRVSDLLALAALLAGLDGNGSAAGELDGGAGIVKEICRICRNFSVHVERAPGAGQVD